MGKSKYSATELAELLTQTGLRLTRQRLFLIALIFEYENDHLTAEDLHTDAVRRGHPVSVATIYQTLNSLTEGGVLRALSFKTSKQYFDRRTDDHYHFFIEKSETIIDIPAGALTVSASLEPPDGMEIVGTDIVVRLRKPTRFGRS